MPRLLSYLFCLGVLLTPFAWANGEASVDTPRFVDTSVSGIALADPKSSVSVLGSDISLQGVPPGWAVYRNASGTEALTLYFHPGDEINSFREFRVSKLGKDGNERRLKQVVTFVTGRGIRLGLTTTAVRKIFGDPTKVNRKNHQLTYEYKLADYHNSAFLQRYNASGYKATYVFENNRLVDFSFGFELP